MRISANAEIDRELGQIQTPEVRTVERNGKTYQQNTSNIGKAKPKADASPAADPVWPFQSAAETTTEAEAPVGELAELRKVVATLQAALKDAISDNEMMGRAFDADDKIKAAMDEARRQKASADSAGNKYNAQQGKVVAMANQVRPAAARPRQIPRHRQVSLPATRTPATRR